ncbi:MAG: phosphoribosylaminoimidazolesuccinocarboxamide synthase [bacterium]
MKGTELRPLTTIELVGVERVAGGKVREIFRVGDELLIVCTDRLSAFDVVLPDGIPDKGRVLTRLSRFWFERFAGIVPNHFITTDVERFPAQLERFADQLRGRSMLVRRAEPLPVECIVRGYLVGSGWKEYRETGRVCGIELPAGLRLADRLPEPIFTPSTKATDGHDINISREELVATVGGSFADIIEDASVRLYREAAKYALARGIIIADTKFEFGVCDGRLMLIDEALTPDSSRFWEASEYRVGESPVSFDKQFVRDYLEGLDWDKTPPGPSLPGEIIEGTAERYREACRRLVGCELDPR